MSQFFDQRFRSFIAAQYNGIDPSDQPVQQRLAIEDAFYAGASVGFFQGVGATDAELLEGNVELTAFGKRIVELYREAGLPLGHRIS